MTRDEQYIENLIREGEGERLDFKYHVADARKIAITMVAFANTSGGSLLLGVKDNGKVIGVESEEEIYMMETAGKLYCRPEIDFVVKEFQVEDKVVLEVKIPEGKEKPFYARDENGRYGVYVRVNDENKFANRVIVEVFKRQSKKKDTFIPYSPNEKLVLNYLKDHPDITLQKFSKMIGSPKRKAENILINLISAGLLSIKYINKDFHYILEDE